MRGGTAGLLLGTLLVALAARSARAEVIQVRIESIEYAPEKVAAHVGDTIEWVNAGIVAHTATARDGAFDVTLAPNVTKRVMLKTAGTVDYYCQFHPNMTGQIVVAK
jgi:plastocyanin